MLIPIPEWEEVLPHFSPAEVEAVDRATTGEMFCPPALVVDVDRLRNKPSILGKLRLMIPSLWRTEGVGHA